MRSLSETKSSDRTRGKKLAFTSLIKISHSYYHLPSWCSISFTFFAFVTATSVCLSHRGHALVMETLQRIVYLSGVLTLNTHSSFGEFEATDSSKYSSTTPYCVRVDRQQFLVLTLSIEQMKTFDCCLVYSSDMK